MAGLSTTMLANLSTLIATSANSAAASSVLTSIVMSTASSVLLSSTTSPSITTMAETYSSVLSSSSSSPFTITTSSPLLSSSTLLTATSRLINPAQNRSSGAGRRYTTSTLSPWRTSSLGANLTRALFTTAVNSSSPLPSSAYNQPPDYRNYVRSVGLGPVILDILITLFLTTFITGLVMNTFLVIALMRRKRPSTPADLVVSNMHFCLYYLFLDSLVLFNELFVTPKPTVDFNAFYVSNPFTNCAMPYLFAVFHMGFFGCVAVLSAILFMNVVHAPMSRIASMRNVAMALIFIWTFCILANVHFLLAHCERFDYEYFIEYVQNVWIKFLIVDGTAFVMSFVMLTRTILHIMRSDSPDRLLLKYEAFGYLIVLLAYSMPLIVDALCALVAEERMTLTSHRILTVAVREISYCTIPAALARFRPLSRSDCHSLLDSIRACFSRNFNRLSAASSRRLNGVRWSSSASNNNQRYFLAATNPTSGYGDNGGSSAGNGRSGGGRRLDDDQVQILSICQDPQAGFEDGL